MAEGLLTMTGEARSAKKQEMADGERPRSRQIFDRGRQLLVGGVDSPVRAFGAVGGTPLVVDRAAGAELWDVDGHAYLDYVCSWGALILGHAHPDSRRGPRRAGAARGTAATA